MQNKRSNLQRGYAKLRYNELLYKYILYKYNAQLVVSIITISV